MAIDKLIPRHLNLDDDERLVQSMQMTNAENVFISGDEENDAGVVKQADGNVEVTPKTTADTIPSSGVSTVIGSVNFDAGGVVFYFLYNTTDDHGVYMYEQDENKYVNLYQNSALAFNKGMHIQGDVVKTGKGDTLLYFTDGKNEPRKLNVSRLLSNSYEDGINDNTASTVSNYITVCKRPPMKPPTFSFSVSGDVNSNNRVIDRVFQFATQYVYADGEVSAIGPYSKLTYEDNHFNVDGTMADLYNTPFDSIDVIQEKVKFSSENQDGDVVAVRFLARAGNTSSFVVFDEVDTAYDNGETVSNFTNTKAYRFISEQETNKLFDAVPLKAKTLSVVENRLFFGNYVDGFDTSEWIQTKSSDTRSQSFPVTVGVQNGTFEAVEGIESSADMQGEQVPSYFVLKSADANETANENLDHFHPDAGGTGIASGASLEGSLGYYQRANTNTQDIAWRLNTNGDDVLDSGEESARLGLSTSYPMEIDIDLSDIPVNGIGTTAEMTLTYVVTGGRPYMIPTYGDQDGKQEHTIRYRPGLGSVLEGQTRNLDLKFFHGGDSIGNEIVDNLNNAGFDPDMAKVCGVGFIGATPDNYWSKSVQVQVNVNNTDTRLTIAQKVVDQIEVDNFGVEIKGTGFLTAHGVNYQRISTVVSDRPGSKACRYLCDGRDAAEDSKVVIEPAFAVVQDNGNRVRVTYKGKSGEFHVSHIQHGGPVANAVDSGFGAIPISPQYADNRQEIILGSSPSVLQANCFAVDGGTNSANQEDLFRCMILDWMHTKTSATIVFGNSGSIQGDEGDNRLTFRSGANHPLGCVFYDHRNRSSTVKLLREAYVPFSGDATSAVGNEVNRLVPYDIDVTFPTSYIPDWAERYQIVYAGNSQYEFSLTHSIPEALVADMSRVVIRDPSLTDSEDLEETLDSSSASGTDAAAETNFPSLAAAESAGILSNAIYLPFRFFEGKTDSYKSSFGVKLNYEFRPGDKLRIVSYQDINPGSGTNPEVTTNFPENHFFDIIDYKYFEHNSDKNVLSLPHAADGNFTKEGEYRRSGWMLIVKENNVHTGFSVADIQGSGSSDNWTKNCVVEILRPKVQPVDEEIVYYEIGESFPVADDSRDDVYNQAASEGAVAFTGVNEIKSRVRLFRGDTIRPVSFPATNNTDPDFFGVGGFGPAGGTFTALSVATHQVQRPLGMYEDGSGTYYRYKVSAAEGPGTAPSNGFDPVNGVTLTDGTVVPSTGVPIAAAFCVFLKGSFRAVHLTDQGDTYYRKRDMRTSAFNSTTLEFDPSDLTEATSVNFRLTNIEDPGFNDYLDSTVTRNYHFGRPHFYNPEFQVNVRGSSVTYSDPYASDGEVLNLSSFNPSLFPFKDYSLRYGDICKLIDEGAGLAVLQERKCSRTPVSRDYINTAEGGMLVTSKGVLGKEVYSPSDFGPGMFSMGVKENDGVIYFVDAEKGVVCALAGNQIKIISDAKASSFFSTKLRSVQAGRSVAGVITGVHIDQDEIVFALNSVRRRTVSAGGTTFGRGLPVDRDTDTSFDLNGLRKVYTIKGSPLDIINETQNWEAHVLDWDEAGKGVVFVDHPTEIGFVESELDAKATQDFLVTNQRNDFYGKMVRQIGSEMRGVLNEGAGGGSKDNSASTLSKSSLSVAETTTIGYNFKQGVWTSKYSYKPEDMCPIFEDMVSFASGKPYLHSPLATPLNYYGVAYNAVVEVVAKKNPSMVKLYKAISLEGNSVWTAELSNREQTSTITTNMWKDQDIDGNIRAGDGFREGMLYCDMPGDTSTASKLDEIAVGVVATSGVDGGNNRVTFTSRVDNIPFNIGDTLFDAADGATTGNTITGVHDRFTLNVSGVSGLADADNLIAKNASDTGHVTGDPLRDYFLKIKLTNSSTTKNELYAVNAIFERSRLHNDRVN